MDTKQFNNMLHSSKTRQFDVKSTDDLINLILNKEIPRLYILVHPDDWCDDFGKWVYNLVTRQFKNVGKSCIRYYKQK